MKNGSGGGCGSFVLCIDNYHNGVPEGRFYTGHSDTACPFESVTQCLSAMEKVMDQAAAAGGHPLFDPLMRPPVPAEHNRTQGARGTFLLRVLFRQNGSWQGSVTWLEGRQEQSFRSVLELILLMDSALQGDKLF